VAIDMGFGAYLSLREGWIDRAQFDRILAQISGYGLSLWHDVLNDDHVIGESHRKIIQKRGGNLVAPIPKGSIGRCGYLNEFSRFALSSALRQYQAICTSYPRAGHGIDPLCSDVGLEAPSIVGTQRVAF
jgi:3-dehydroquinate synthase